MDSYDGHEAQRGVDEPQLDDTNKKRLEDNNETQSSSM